MTSQMFNAIAAVTGQGQNPNTTPAQWGSSQYGYGGSTGGGGSSSAYHVSVRWQLQWQTQLVLEVVDVDVFVFCRSLLRLSSPWPRPWWPPAILTPHQASRPWERRSTRVPRRSPHTRIVTHTGAMFRTTAITAAITATAPAHHHPPHHPEDGHHSSSSRPSEWKNGRMNAGFSTRTRSSHLFSWLMGLPLEGARSPSIYSECFATLPKAPPPLLPADPAAATLLQWTGARWLSSGSKRKKQRDVKKCRGWPPGHRPVPWSRVRPCPLPETQHLYWMKWIDRTRKGGNASPPNPTPPRLILHIAASGQSPHAYAVFPIFPNRLTWSSW